jgi:hypothetical protein
MSISNSYQTRGSINDVEFVACPVDRGINGFPKRDVSYNRINIYNLWPANNFMPDKSFGRVRKDASVTTYRNHQMGPQTDHAYNYFTPFCPKVPV